MAANLVERLREALKACEEIPFKEVNAQKQQIAEQFEQLRKAVYEIVDEKTIILSALKWKQTEKTIFGSGKIKEILEAEAKRIALHYGYSYETVYEMLEVKNDFNYKSIFIIDRSTYTYWILE